MSVSSSLTNFQYWHVLNCLTFYFTLWVFLINYFPLNKSNLLLDKVPDVYSKNMVLLNMFIFDLKIRTKNMSLKAREYSGQCGEFLNTQDKTDLAEETVVGK